MARTPGAKNKIPRELKDGGTGFSWSVPDSTAANAKLKAQNDQLKKRLKAKS